jgi:DNA (cytosine-5)-methyltransferase 1
VLPAVAPAASAIDWSLPAQQIKDRERPLAEKTMARILRGLERVYDEPFAIRLLQSGNPRPLTLPLATLTARQDFGVVLPVAGSTFERTPGNRARNASLVPMDTMTGTLERAVVIPLEKHTEPRLAGRDPVHTIKANGNHHGFVVANYDPGWTRDASAEPIGTITAVDGHSLLIPYNRTGQAVAANREPAPTATTKDRYAILVPPKDSDRPRRKFDPSEIGEARFRMLAIPEVARTMQMHEHKNGDDYVVLGNKREQMRQLGNAVVPNCQTFLVSRIAEALDAAA